jgi:hypothetical protein
MSIETLLATAARCLGPIQSGRAIVFGSAPLALAGLPRQPRDLDLFVSPDLYQELVDDQRPEQTDAQGHHFLLLAEGIEVWASFPGVSWDKVAARARLDPRTSGLKVADLSDVRATKLALGRPRDLADIQLIDALLGRFPEEDEPTESVLRELPEAPPEA